MKVDARVQFPQSAAPTDESLARAVIAFADAFAKGDSDKLRPMLDPAAKSALDTLIKNGGWTSSTGKTVEAVRVSQVAESGEQAAIILAVQEPGSAYPLAWAANKVGDTYIFSGAATPDVTKSRASDFDGGDLSASAATASAPITRVSLGELGQMSKEVGALLKARCVECHGPEKQKGKLRLDQWAALAKVIVPGKADESELIRRVKLPDGDEDHMPNKGDSLTAAEIDLLTKWINGLPPGLETGGSADSGKGTPAPPGTKKRSTGRGNVNVPSGEQPETPTPTGG